MRSMPAACLVALAFTWAAMSFFSLSSEPLYDTRFHLCYRLVCWCSWNQPTYVPLLPILPRVPHLACLALVTSRVSLLLEDADGALSLHFYFLTARIRLQLHKSTFGQPGAPCFWFCDVSPRSQAGNSQLEPG